MPTDNHVIPYRVRRVSHSGGSLKSEKTQPLLAQFPPTRHNHPFSSASFLTSTSAQTTYIPKARPSYRRRCRGCKSYHLCISLRTRGESELEVAKTAVAVQGGGALSYKTQRQQNITFITHSILDFDGIALSPAVEHYNNANIKDRWVPNALWLWTAKRIRSGN